MNANAMGNAFGDVGHHLLVRAALIEATRLRFGQAAPCLRAGLGNADGDKKSTPELIDRSKTARAKAGELMRRAIAEVRRFTEGGSNCAAAGGPETAVEFVCVKISRRSAALVGPRWRTTRLF
jgi:hypothetical protein